MAQSVMTIHVKMHFWVKPVLAVIGFVAPLIWLFGGARGCSWIIENLPALIIKHGMRFEAAAK